MQHNLTKKEKIDKELDYRVADCFLAKDLANFMKDNKSIVIKQTEEMRKEIYLYIKENKKFNFKLHLDILAFFKKLN